MTATLSAPGTRLLASLQALFGGHHIRSTDVDATGERTEAYPVAASVLWSFHGTVDKTATAGDAAIANCHFSDASAFTAHLTDLCQQAEIRLDIRGTFLQRVDAAGSDSLTFGESVQPVHDFGRYSVYRRCVPCKGRGTVDCGGCGGRGRQRCARCGGGGTQTRTVMRTRWNGRHNESYPETVYESCGGCLGSGRVVCFHCGGSGTQRCGACAGHGYFTDIAHVTAIARPQWQVAEPAGLAATALRAALLDVGPARASTLAAFELARTSYDDETHWRVQYEGRAEVVELDVAARQDAYVVAAAGPAPTPITTPPVFDRLLAAELAGARQWLALGKSRMTQRRARQLFNQYRSLPALDASLRAIAALKGEARAHPQRAVVSAMHGFISPDAATALGNVVGHVLHRVSPPYSAGAWAILGVPVGLGALLISANEFSGPHGAGILNFILPLALAMVLSAFAMAVTAIPAWLLSVCVTAAAKQRIPKPYRQAGRNGAPFKGSLKMVAGAALVGALLGQASHLGFFAPVLAPREPMVKAIAQSALPYLPPDLWAKVSPMRSGGAVSVSELTDAPLVRQVQRSLIRLRLLHGRADGVMGTQTLAAIERYKQQFHLPPALALPDVVKDMEQRVPPT